MRVLFGTVTVGVRGMTATETAETLTMYQMVVLTAVFALTLPFSWVAPTAADWGAMVVNGLGNGLGQYLWTRALHLAPTSAGGAVQLLLAGVAIILDFWCGRRPDGRAACGLRDRGGVGHVPAVGTSRGKVRRPGPRASRPHLSFVCKKSGRDQSRLAATLAL